MEENINEEDVREFYRLLEHKNQTEIRVIELSEDFKTSKVKKHFFVSSEEEFISKVKEFNGKYNLYAGLNERKDRGTVAKDVISIKRFFIDIDCKIKPSSEEDLIECKRDTDEIIKDIFEKTNQKPTIIFSGNGYQLIYYIPVIEIDDNNRDEINDKIQSYSKELIKKFSNDKIKLDNVGDLPRIIRITGTTNIKGGKLSKFVEINKDDNKLLEDYILSLEKQTTTSTKSKDTSGSGLEYRRIIALLWEGKSREEIYKLMEVYRKWTSSTEQYRTLTFESAEEFYLKEKAGKENKSLDTNFIFDDDLLVKQKIFVQDKISSNIFSYGIFLPKNVTYKREKRRVTKQEWIPVLITSGNNKLIEIDEESLEKNNKIRFDDIPTKFKLRYSLKNTKAYLENSNLIIDKSKLYEKIRNQYSKYCVFIDDTWYDIHTLWDIGTYFFMLFSHYPILELRGMTGTGKTKIMNISSYMTFNGSDIMINPSESTLFRETQGRRITKYIDEAEKLFAYNKNSGKYEGDTRAELLNGSYSKNSFVPRQEKEGNKFVTKWYACYSPTALGSINGVHGATENRAITHITTKNNRNDARGSLEPEDDDKDIIWQEIRDDLFLFGLNYWQEIEKIYFEIDKRTTKTEARILQLWKPLFTIVKFIDENLYIKVEQFASELSEQKINDLISEGSIEDRLLTILYHILRKEDLNKVYVQNIREEYNSSCENEKEKLSKHSKTISSRLDNLGLKKYRKTDTNKGAYYEINFKNFRKIIEPIKPTLFSEDLKG